METAGHATGCFVCGRVACLFRVLSRLSWLSAPSVPGGMESWTSMGDLCSDSRRNHKVICVVESPKDVSAIERSGGFDGVYHVLHGLLSPMNSIGPQQLKIKELMARLSDTDEVIMATSPTIEGEATATYLSRMIKQLGVKVTRLAYGLPAGASLEYADDVTLQRALENRNEI